MWGERALAMRKDKNAIERRLHEVAESSAELRAEIKRLERALKKPERLLDRPQLVPTTPVTPRIRPAVSTTALAVETTPSVVTEPAPYHEPTGRASDRRIAVSGNETFARYFSSTRFLGPPALGRERNIQRNRAILLVIGAVILGYIVYKFIAR